MEPDKFASRLASNDGCGIVHFIQQDFLQAIDLWVQTFKSSHHEINEVVNP